MHKDRITFLLEQYLEGRLSGADLQELNDYLGRDDAAGEMRSALQSIIYRFPEQSGYRQADWDPLFQKIMKGLAPHVGQRPEPARRRKMTLNPRRSMAAATILALLAGTGWFLQTARIRSGPRVIVHAAIPPADVDIAPGSNKATLTLADNATISLDDAKDGLLGRQGNAQLIKQKDGELAYRVTGRPLEGGSLQYNLLTTPRGGQYHLTLPDGSKVWLNAASSLKYPASFSGSQRVVELKGEAYFEIARNASMPFRVTVLSDRGKDPLVVDVVGTHFNIKAYTDEPAINTTLLEGAVVVRKGNASALIRPGEEVRSKGDDALKVGMADTEEAIAWKNGLFRFSEATIQDVMRQVSRWYDVEVVYVNEVPKDLFQGEIYRNVNVSKVLKVLEASGVHFRVEGKKIFVQS